MLCNVASKEKGKAKEEGDKKMGKECALPLVLIKREEKGQGIPSKQRGEEASNEDEQKVMKGE